MNRNISSAGNKCSDHADDTGLSTETSYNDNNGNRRMDSVNVDAEQMLAYGLHQPLII